MQMTLRNSVKTCFESAPVWMLRTTKDSWYGYRHGHLAESLLDLRAHVLQSTADDVTGLLAWGSLRLEGWSCVPTKVAMVTGTAHGWILTYCYPLILEVTEVWSVEATKVTMPTEQPAGWTLLWPTVRCVVVWPPIGRGGATLLFGDERWGVCDRRGASSEA